MPAGTAARIPDWLTPPNLLTYLRLGLMPLIAAAIVQGRHQSALTLVVVAGLSDGVDGYLARRFRWQTRLGAYLDPIADKLLLVVVYGALTMYGSAPLWLFVLVLLRDLWILSMVAYAWFATSIREFPPRRAGKFSTAVQIALAATLLVRNVFPVWVPEAIVLILVSLVAVVAIWSGADYTVVALLRYRAWRRSESDKRRSRSTN